jgi:3'-phosphoadenosine 5'-phosphosulfate sulfotransferase (PAPS reductase)/FAD synthetase
MSRVIVALSGGKASAWCADWALKTYPKNSVILYFNDTKWEHSDLYRFLQDLSAYFTKEIIYDVDGRTPEDLFFEQGMLGSDRHPFCSSTLKGKRLQEFYQPHDILVFGIAPHESHRAKRITDVYASLSAKNNKPCYLRFPLITENVTDEQIDQFLKDANIEQPLLYKLGFTHNNCAGGCVRQGINSWKHLYRTLPEVYAERERVEKEFSKEIGRKSTFHSSISLEDLRIQLEHESLQLDLFSYDPSTECVGICSTVF